MKAVPPYAALEQLSWQRERFGKLAAPVMKRRVEAGDLAHPRPALTHAANRRERLRLVQRRQRRERLEVRQHCVIDDDGARPARPAVHDPVADGDRRRAAELGVEPASHDGERARVIAGARGLLWRGVADHEPRLGADAVDEPVYGEAWPISCGDVEE